MKGDEGMAEYRDEIDAIWEAALAHNNFLEMVFERSDEGLINFGWDGRSA